MREYHAMGPGGRVGKPQPACQWICWLAWSAVLGVVGLINLVAVPAVELSGPQAARPQAAVPPWPTGSFVMLRDGGVLAGQLLSLSKEVLEFESDSFGLLKMSPAAVVGYRQNTAVGPPLSVQQPAAQVTVILANGDRVDADALAIENGQCQVSLAPAFNEGRDVTLPLERVAAIDWQGWLTGQPLNKRLHERPDATEKDISWVALEDGSRFLVKAAEMAGPRARTRLRPVLTGLPAALECFSEEIAVRLLASTSCWLAFEKARVLPITLVRLDQPDEELLSVRSGHRFRAGATCSGDWPRLRGQTGFSAVAIHAPACVEYAIDPAANRFTAVVGLDDSVGKGGSVVIRVTAPSARQPLSAFSEADRDDVFAEELFCSGLIRGGEIPTQIDLPLQRVACLRLHVEPATAANVLDRTIWIDPRVYYPAIR